MPRTTARTIGKLMIWGWVGLFYFNAFSSLDLDPVVSSGLATLPLGLVWMVSFHRGRSSGSAGGPGLSNVQSLNQPKSWGKGN
jgi:hypothetical protein